MVALVKLLIPIHSWRIVCGKLANAVAQGWVGFNSRGLKLAKNIRWDVQGIDAMQPDAWYLLVANHQSMVDIVVLQSIFHRKIPPLKFFLKKELIWVPFLGIVWWTLDFPFMERTSSARKDMETARNACDKFRLLPVTIMNFVEGTRFTAAKQENENSPFTYLLKPKSGAMAVVLCTLGSATSLHTGCDNRISGRNSGVVDIFVHQLPGNQSTGKTNTRHPGVARRLSYRPGIPPTVQGLAG